MTSTLFTLLTFAAVPAAAQVRDADANPPVEIPRIEATEIFESDATAVGAVRLIRLPLARRL